MHNAVLEIALFAAARALALLVRLDARLGRVVGGLLPKPGSIRTLSSMRTLITHTHNVKVKYKQRETM